MSRSEKTVAALVKRLCEAKAEIERLKQCPPELRHVVDKVTRERNDVIQAINTLRSEPSGEVWVKQEFDDRERRWSPPVTIGPDGESRYSNTATLDRAIGWFWKNTLKGFAYINDFEMPAARLINVKTGYAIPLTLRGVAMETK